MSPTKILLKSFFILSLAFTMVNSYKNQLFTISSIDDSKPQEYNCAVYEGVQNKSIAFIYNNGEALPKDALKPTTKSTTELTKTIIQNPFEIFQRFLHAFIYGGKIEEIDSLKNISKLPEQDKNNTDSLLHYVMGDFMQLVSLCKLFNNRSGVHIPQSELMHRGYCELEITKDFMQTAVNAFAIFLYGSISDIQRLPADYVLRSSRAISMMLIAREKLVATWQVVRGSNRTIDITYETLEKYRPLFKYINGRELARLNLSNDRILSYIGTHEGLNRHQVGVIASKYIEINKSWSQPKYLNLMNNLLCGVPMTYMRQLPVSTYLQLSHQVFYHIRACDPLQRRFYLAMMTRTQALGKAYSWSAQDVFRLGLLLAEVDGRDLSAVNPRAMSGVTAQVMLVMPPESLQYLSDLQLQYIGPKPMNILRRKLKAYQDRLQLNKAGLSNILDIFKCIILIIIVTIK